MAGRVKATPSGPSRHCRIVSSTVAEVILRRYRLGGGSGAMPFEWAACALAALLVALLAWLRSTVRRLQLQRRLAACAAAAKGAPPPVMPHVVAGLPVLGSALALGSGGADFLRQCRETVGGLCTASSTACCHALTSKPLAAAVEALAPPLVPLTHAALSPTPPHRCSTATPSRCACWASA